MAIIGQVSGAHTLMGKAAILSELYRCVRDAPSAGENLPQSVKA